MFTNTSSTSGSVSNAVNGSDGGRSAAASSSAEFGVLRVFGEAHTPEIYGSTTYGFANASFQDDFLFAAAGRTGQSGTFTFSLYIDGSLSAGVRGSVPESDRFSYAGATFGLAKNGVSLIHGSTSERVLSNGTTEVIGEAFLNRTNTFAVPFTFGTPFELRISLGAQTNARGEYGADCIADIGHTLAWGGISSVNDSTNAPVNNYNLSSGSGTDFTQPIPEPTTAALLLGGAAAGLLTLRRRRSIC
jgi:hypothetical protein